MPFCLRWTSHRVVIKEIGGSQCEGCATAPNSLSRYTCRSRSLLRPTFFLPRNSIRRCWLLTRTSVRFWPRASLERRRSAPLERTQHPNNSPILSSTSQVFVRSSTSNTPQFLSVLKYCTLITYLSSFVDVILQARVALALSDSASVTTALESDLEPFDKLRRYEMKAVSVFRFSHGSLFFRFSWASIWLLPRMAMSRFLSKTAFSPIGKSPIYASMSTSFI